MGAFGRLGEEKGDEEEAAAPEPQPHGMYEFVEVPVNAHELEEGLQKMKEAREKYDGDAQMDEEAFEVAVSTAKSREREYAEAAAENYAEAHGLSSEEKIEKLEAERIDIERKQERTRAEINAQREELARGMREMGVTQLPDVAEAETAARGGHRGGGEARRGGRRGVGGAKVTRTRRPRPGSARTRRRRGGRRGLAPHEPASARLGD